MLNVYQHFFELKQRVLYLFLNYLLLFLVIITKSNSIIFFFLEPFFIKDQEILFFNPLESILFHFLVYSCPLLIFHLPYLFYIVFCYFKPGLFKLEKHLFVVSMYYFTTLLFFLTFMFFSFFLPFCINFFISFENFRFNNYFFLKFSLNGIDCIFFSIKMYCSFFIICCLPFCIFVFTFFRPINICLLLQNRKEYFLSCLIIASVMSPPDIFSQFLCFAILFFILEIVIFFSVIIYTYHLKESCSNGNEVSLLNLSLLFLIE